MAFKRVMGYDARWSAAPDTGALRVRIEDIGWQEVSLSGTAEYAIVLALLQGSDEKPLYVNENAQFTTDPSWD